MGFGDGADDGEAEAGAPLVFAGGDEAAEDVVSDVAGELALAADDDTSLAVASEHGDMHGRAGNGVEDGVVEQIADGAAEPGGLALELDGRELVEDDACARGEHVDAALHELDE